MSEKSFAGHIMIIDDEDVVRFLLCDIIKEMGYDVTDFGNPMNAISFYETNYEKINLIIFDMTMPELNGRETFFLLKKINPDIKSIVLSGFSLNEDIDKVMKDGCLMHLKKPVKILELKNAVAKALSHDIKEGQSFFSHENLLKDLDIPSSDIETALLNLDGNAELYLKMLRKFSDNYSGAGKKMRELLDKKDLENLFVFSHSMKSIAANLGFSKLREISELIEMNCQKNEIDDLSKNGDTFNSETVSLIKKISSFLDSKNINNTSAADSKNQSQLVGISTVLKYLDEMIEMAEKCRPVQISDIFYSNLKHITCANFGYIEKEELFKRMRRYDFDDLISFIKKLKIELQEKDK